MKTLLLALLIPAFACAPGNQCQADASAGGTLCIPDAGALADAPLDYAVQEICGSMCDDFEPTCQVTRDGGELTVALVGTRCSTPSMPCPELCSQRRFRCALGPLPAGSYTVRSGLRPALTLQVSDAGLARCGD